eukprot:CAMPEP_0117452742 /NCGR_PEP_ID=MMETSP0759-20121206/9798_1 /TAXON_ID=63605 /ORGANISM="Percolomonas cosmopolitus, Strain WS" /LENGTH=902 /DNA_ID=CAMNT_0005245619 /DNA_START=209 /DNA_END=2917 /DNA_ORIENTATION=+
MSLTILFSALLLTVTLSFASSLEFTNPLNRTSFKIAWFLESDFDTYDWSYQFGIAHSTLHNLLEEKYPECTFESTIEVLLPPEGESEATQDDAYKQKARYAIKKKVDAGFNLIIYPSFFMQDVALESSVLYPHVGFMNLPGPNTGGDNYVALDARIYQALYLGGYLAAKESKTGTIAFLRSFPFASVNYYLYAFAKGAREAVPSIKIVTPFAGFWNPNNTHAEALLNYVKANDADIWAGAINGKIFYDLSRTMGLKAIAWTFDYQNLVGSDTVLASAVRHFYPIVERFSLEYFKMGKYSLSTYMGGIDDGVVALSGISPQVPLSLRNTIEARSAALNSTTDTILCGPISDSNGVEKVPAGTCLNELTMKTQITWAEGTDLGGVILPAEWCSPGERYEYDARTNAIKCIACAPGEFSTKAAPTCQKCPAETYSNAETGYISCMSCSSSYTSEPGSSSCSYIPQWELIIPIPLACLFLILVSLCVIVCMCAVALRSRKKNKMLQIAARKTEQISQSVAEMHLNSPECKELLNKKSSSMTRVEKSLQEIIRNLKEYRHYLPSHLFAKNSEYSADEMPTEDSQSDAGSSSRGLKAGSSKRIVPLGAGSMGTRSVTSLGSGSVSKKKVSRKSRMRIHLQDRVATVLIVSIGNIGYIAKAMSNIELLEIQNTFLSIITDSVFSTCGVFHNIVNGTAICSFNAASDIDENSVSAVKAAVLIKRGVHEFNRNTLIDKCVSLDLSISVVTDHVQCGNIGSSSVRSFTIIGKPVEYAIELERLNSRYGSVILMNETCVNNGIRSLFTHHQVDIVDVNGTAQSVFEVIDVSENNRRTEEWMYEAKSDPITAGKFDEVNKVWELIAEDQHEQAQEALKKLENIPEEEMERMQRRIDGQKCLLHIGGNVEELSSR